MNIITMLLVNPLFVQNLQPEGDRNKRDEDETLEHSKPRPVWWWIGRKIAMDIYLGAA